MSDTGVGTPPAVPSTILRWLDSIIEHADEFGADEVRVHVHMLRLARKLLAATDPTHLDADKGDLLPPLMPEFHRLVNPPRLFQTRAADRLWAFLVPHLGAMDAGFVSAALETIERDACQVTERLSVGDPRKQSSGW